MSRTTEYISANKRLLFCLKVALSLGLLAYLLTLIDVGELAARFHGVYVPLIVCAGVVLLLQSVLSALKWRLLLQADSVEMPYCFLLKTYLIGNFISLFLPSSFGGDIYRVIAVRSVNRELVKSASSVLFDRLTGLFALVSIAIISYMFLPQGHHSWTVFAAYCAGTATLFVALTSERCVFLLRRVRHRLLAGAAAMLDSFRTYTGSYRRFGVVLAISFFFQFNIVVVNKMYSVALGMDIAFGLLLIIIPLIYLTEALPISINGLGVRESAFVFFFTALGYRAEDGLALALLVIAMRYLVGLVGGLLLTATLVQRGSAAGSLGKPG